MGPRGECEAKWNSCIHAGRKWKRWQGSLEEHKGEVRGKG